MSGISSVPVVWFMFFVLKLYKCTTFIKIATLLTIYFFTFVKQANIMADKIHTGMRVDASQLDKLKYIAWNDRRTFTSVMDMAIEDYITKWEAANGPITQKLLEKAKIK